MAHIPGPAPPQHPPQYAGMLHPGPPGQGHMGTGPSAMHPQHMGGHMGPAGGAMQHCMMQPPPPPPPPSHHIQQQQHGEWGAAPGAAAGGMGGHGQQQQQQLPPAYSLQAVDSGPSPLAPPLPATPPPPPPPPSTSSGANAPAAGALPGRDSDSNCGLHKQVPHVMAGALMEAVAAAQTFDPSAWVGIGVCAQHTRATSGPQEPLVCGPRPSKNG